jgi:hypothetical protein
MAAYTLYDASIVLAKDALTSLSAIIAKAEGSSAAASIPEARIHSDMLPFTFQVHFVTQTISKMIARLTGAEPKEYENNLETYDAMKARIADVQAQVDAVDRDVVNGREKEIVSLGMGKDSPEYKLEGWKYVHGYAVPNIYFHLTTAYDIARKEGVDVGKRDFIMPFIGKFLSS